MTDINFLRETQNWGANEIVIMTVRGNKAAFCGSVCQIFVSTLEATSSTYTNVQPNGMFCQEMVHLLTCFFFSTVMVGHHLLTY